MYLRSLRNPVSSVIRLLIVIFLLGAGAAYSQGRLGLPSAPRVDSIMPDTLNQGQSATLLIRGRGLHAGMGVDLGEGVTGGTLIMVNDTTARVTVRVHSGAAPGLRTLALVIDGVPRAQRATVTIAGGTAHSDSAPATPAAPDGPIGFVQAAPAGSTPAAPDGPPGFVQAAPTTAAPDSATSSALRLLRITPNRLQIGQSYSLNLAGQGFAHGMSVDFGDGIVVRGAVRVTSANTATARVQVTGDALPGYRTVTASITAAVGTPGIVAIPGGTVQAQAPRALEIFGTAATTATPPPSGGFTPPAKGGFAPPPPGGGFAPPPVVQATPTLPPVPKITKITPSKMTAGKSYAVTLEGQHLSNQLLLDFGNGIQVQGPLISAASNKLQATVKVDKQATAGTRKITASVKKGSAGVQQPAQFAVLAAVTKKPKPQLVKLQLPKLDITDILKGRIDLQAPQWRQQIGSQAPIKDPITGKPLTEPTPIYKADVPLLHDEALFSWKETNPGTSEWFEIRFYAKGKLAARRRIEVTEHKLFGKPIPVLPTWFRPDAALLAELLKHAPPTSTGQMQQSAGAFQQNIPVQGVSPAGGAMPSAADLVNTAFTSATLHWEVAGYRRYHASGVVKTALVDEPILVAAAKQAAPATQSDAQTPKLGQGFVETEVALSERWPLATPSPPTGLGCGSEQGSLSLTNLDKGAKQQGSSIVVEAGDGHVGDRFRLKGTFKLNNSPYASHPETQQTSFKNPVTQKTQVVATTWQFDNLFVDWGDGTVTPLAMTQIGSAGSYAAGDTLSLGEGHQHSYAGTGPYTVRIYQLSAKDVQGGGQVAAAQAIDKDLSLYAQVAALTPGSNTGKEQMKWSKAVADRAFMTFCRNVRIEPRTDPASYGPLQLVEIGIDGFAGQQESAKGATKVGARQKPAVNAAKPTLSAAPSAGNMLQAQPKPQLSFGDLPTFSTCSSELTAEAAVRYSGQGKARLRWLLDGVAIGEDERVFGPSQPRSQEDLAKLAGKKSWFDLTPVAPPRVDVESGLPSPPIGLSTLGKRTLRVEAEVIPEPKRNNLYDTLTAAFGANGQPANAGLARALAGQFKNAPKIGVLSPHKVPQQGVGVVSYLNEPLRQLALTAEPIPKPIQVAALSLQPGVAATLSDATLPAAGKLGPKKEPPGYVVSQPLDYLVVGADAKQACTFEFPVPGGSFTVAGLQAPGGQPKVTESNGRYSGSGMLLVKLPSGGDAVKQWPVPITFKEWKLKPDGVTVETGEFAITNTGLTDLPLPALKASVAKLQGKAGVGVDAWLNARLTHPELLEAQAGKAPAWQNVKGTLSPAGDWYAAALPMADTLLYLGGYRIDPDKVALDLSLTEGSGTDSACASGAGAAFLGVHLGEQATLTAFDFGLKGTPTAKVSNWGIDANGVCGTGNLGAFQTALDKGKIAWDNIAVQAGGGKLKATYKNLRVTVPWINAELKGSGDPVFNAGQGAGTVTLALTGQAAPVTNGPITLEATNLALTQKPGIGWAVTSDTRFDFAGADKTFAKDVWLTGLLFGMDGRAYLPNGPQGATLTSTSGFIAQGPVTLKSAKVSAPASTSERLHFDFVADLKLSKALEAKDMPISYRITESSAGTYSGSGPVVGKVPITFAFPKTDTITKGTIFPEYMGSGANTSAAIDPPAPLSWVTPAHAATKQVIYRGTTNMDFFKSAALPVTGAFELGYFGSNDYWAAVLVYNIPPPGITMVPNLLSLYGLGGGLGYNVEPGSLSHNLANVIPKATGNSVYGANVTMGSAFDAGFAYTMKGYFNVDPKNPALKMDFGLWLLSSNHGGSAPINGSLGYGSGIFHAEMGGEQNFLGGFGRVKANPGALQAHFEDSGDWHLYAGTEANPVQGEVAKLINGGVWLNLGRDEGLRVGAKADARFPDIDCNSGTCANVSGKVQADVTITPKPQATAKNKVNVAANGCLGGGCLSLSVGADMTVAGPSPELGFGFSLNGCPIGKLTVSMTVLPAPKPGISGSFCSWGETGAAIVKGAGNLMKGIGSAAEGAWNAVKSCFGFC